MIQFRATYFDSFLARIPSFERIDFRFKNN